MVQLLGSWKKVQSQYFPLINLKIFNQFIDFKITECFKLEKKIKINRIETTIEQEYYDTIIITSVEINEWIFSSNYIWQYKNRYKKKKKIIVVTITFVFVELCNSFD